MKDFLDGLPEPQRTTLERVLSGVRQLPNLTEVRGRGSLGRQQVDQLSDLDVVLVVSGQEALEVSVAASLATLSNQLNLVAPVWADDVVGNFGGEGVVLLVEQDSRVVEVDIYVIEQSKVLATWPCLLDCEGSLTRTSSYGGTNEGSPRVLTPADGDGSWYLMGAALELLWLRKRVARGERIRSLGAWNAFLERLRQSVLEGWPYEGAERGWPALEQLAIGESEAQFTNVFETLAARSIPTWGPEIYYMGMAGWSGVANQLVNRHRELAPLVGQLRRVLEDGASSLTSWFSEDPRPRNHWCGLSLA